MSRCALPILVLALAAPPRHALAEGAPTAAAPTSAASAATAAGSASEQRYAEAQQHFIAGRYTEALPIFRSLYAESGSPNASLYVARCLREMGQLAEAYDEMVLTERVATERARAEERFVGTRESARGELRELEARVGRITLEVPARPGGLEIEVNGRPVAAERWGTPLAVIPGTVRLWASAPRHATVRQDVEVAPGSAQTVTVFMVPGADGAAPPGAGARPGVGAAHRQSPVPPAGAAQDGGSGGSGLVVAGVVAVTLGALGMGTFAVAGILAENRFADIEDECNGNRCPDPSYNDSIDMGRKLDTVANVGLGVGLVGLVSGGVLIAIGLATAEPPAAPGAGPPKQGLWLEGAPGGGRVGYRLRF